MRIKEDFGVTSAKLDALKARIARLGIDPAAIEESFSRGGGKGGQKVNKTANRVQLHYPPLELRVACHRERSRALNRFLALRELVDQVEMKVSPETSKRLKEIERVRRRKSRAAARAAAKYGPAGVSAPSPPPPAPRPAPPGRAWSPRPARSPGRA